ncbi:phenylacetate--CoA ligase family protein [Rheinheimera sp. F8]|uniref:phenylacetate--CoA ligase family protein n=1 Tax=Rheinheimera sp. F8 TaxID=1763998 RepID=UPI000744B2F1|nr:phenylacetate--CoA ligase family protein [Rheinheimera sp. F8]ALZ77061.1 hypothetical protein ATY27_15715 [Rheinheimera sp. F8]
MFVKDFLWLLFKENLLINWVYRHLLGSVFPVLQQQVPACDLSNKDTYKTTKLKKPMFSVTGYTSGTTNQPMTVYRSVKSILLEEYMVKTFLALHRVQLKAKIAVLRGDMIKASTDNTPPFWRFAPFTGRVFFSSFHLSPENVPAYLQQLSKEKPDIIMAYPSSITFLAKQAKLLGWVPDWPFSGVFTSSETFTPENQQICREVFGKVFDHYGQAERVAALQQCAFGHYHVREDYSVVEFVDDEHGTKIVGTNAHNSAMPLRRYDTGDYVEGLNKLGNCPCGNHSPYVTRILGRDDDYLILTDGRHIGRMDVAFKGVEGLLECQLVQTDGKTLEVHFVTQPGYSNSQLEQDLAAVLQQRLGDNLQLKFIQQLSIARTKAGKFRSVIRLNVGNSSVSN